MQLSGWVRLWIVASLVWWVGGTVWLSKIEVHRFGIPLRMPEIFYSPPEFSLPCIDKANPNDADAGPWPLCSQQEEVKQNSRRFWENAWAYWSAAAWSEGFLPLVLFGPFILGALMFGIGWISRGFGSTVDKSPSDKDGAPPH